MVQRGVRALRPRIPALALFILVAMCTERDPLGPASWRTPMGSSTANPPQVLVGAGDIAVCGGSRDEATAALLDGIEGTVFTTGDNAYERGTNTEFQNCYHPSWGRH